MIYGFSSTTHTETAQRTFHRSLKRSRFRSSFDPPAAAGGVLPLGFHRGKSVCSKEDLTGLPQFCAVISSQFLVEWVYC
jgi:hypothetical protein